MGLIVVTSELKVSTEPENLNEAEHLASIDWEKTTARRDEKHLYFQTWCALY